jgi:hypothetical protein
MLTVLVVCLVIFVLGMIGIGALLSVFKIAQFASISTIAARVIAGIGLIAASAGVGALLLFALNSTVKKLGSYARLHYRLLKTEHRSA